jgi:beta-galactosidase
VAPILHVVPEELRQRIAAFVESGGHLVTTYFSGIVDQNDHVWLGGYPGAFRELLGIRIEEFGPLPDVTEIPLDSGWTGRLWADQMEVISCDVDVLHRFAAGTCEGRPAVTRRALRSGSASYVATALGPDGLGPLTAELAELAGIAPDLPAELRGSVELAVRTDGSRRFLFLINRTDEKVDISGLCGRVLAGAIEGEAGKLGGRGVVVLECTP